MSTNSRNRRVEVLSPRVRIQRAWTRLHTRIDELAVRQRFLIFITLMAVMVAGFNVLVINPRFARHQVLSQQMQAEFVQIAEVREQIRQKVAAYDSHPQDEKKAELAELNKKANRLRKLLQDMQHDLVSSDDMATLLENMLKKNNRLYLSSLRTLPEQIVDQSSADTSQTVPQTDLGVRIDPGDGSSVPSTIGRVYKHGVEMTIEGSYSDMVDYLAALESMPWQLFWGRAQLKTLENGRLSLTLRLYTISLSKNWLNI